MCEALDELIKEGEARGEARIKARNIAFLINMVKKGNSRLSVGYYYVLFEFGVVTDNARKEQYKKAETETKTEVYQKNELEYLKNPIVAEFLSLYTNIEMSFRIIYPQFT